MAITADAVKQLRERTGAGIMDCKRALQQTGGDPEKAVDYLREQGMLKAAKRSGRVTKEGIISCYIHQGSKLGVLVELNCETDFVARTNEFQQLANDIAKQVAAMDPLAVERSGISAEIIEKEKAIYRAQALKEGKPEKIIDRIVAGRLEKYYQENCLMEQAFIRNPEKTIEQLTKEIIAKTGENITVRRFVRFQLGE